MKRSVSNPPFLAVAVALVLTGECSGHAQHISHEGWSLDADPGAGVLKIGHERLGDLLTHIQLNVQSARGLTSCRTWTCTPREPVTLVIQTKEPQTTWVFEMTASALKLSCSAPNGLLTARTPVSKDRMVARLLDLEGFPVEWSGTEEVTNGYGGNRTHNPSHLPRRNPECMYFGLGQVSGSIFHSLFDRPTDIAIDFPEQTRLQTTANRPGALEVILPLPASAEIRLTPDYYTHSLGLPFYVPLREDRFPRPPMVWRSWTSYFGEVTEAAVATNADWIAEHLKPYGFQYVQLDDGYDRDLKEGHYWLDHWDPKTFPHGPQWLANYIRSKGLHAGLWLVPNACAGPVESHPDWYLRDKEGKIIQDYGTPALDSTNPEVLDFLTKLFTTLRDWGFDYYKFDGEQALPKYVPAVDRDRLHDKSVDPLVAYRHRLEVIRQVIGPQSFVEGCPAGTPLNGIGFFNSYFNGEDLYSSWQGMYPLFSSINANAFLNRIVVYVMPGEGIEVGEPMSADETRHRRSNGLVKTAADRENPLTEFGVSLAEARTLVSLVALTGVAYSLTSVMPELPAERVALLQRTLPTMPITPIDLFSRGTDIDWDTFKRVRADTYIHNYPEVVDLKIDGAAGVYDVVALPNWRGSPVTKNLSFAEKLGLDPTAKYAVFDFWNQQLLGVFADHINTEIDSHDTRVLQIHPLRNRPQLIGTSRHITGEYSILEQKWDEAGRSLTGRSETVPGAPYTLFVHVPKDRAVSNVRATVQGGKILSVQHHRSDESLSIMFAGQSEPVDWRIEFGGAHVR
jgi:hypothetical protein